MNQPARTRRVQAPLQFSAKSPAHVSRSCRNLPPAAIKSPAFRCVADSLKSRRQFPSVPEFARSILAGPSELCPRRHGRCLRQFTRSPPVEPIEQRTRSCYRPSITIKDQSARRSDAGLARLHLRQRDRYSKRRFFHAAKEIQGHPVLLDGNASASAIRSWPSHGGRRVDQRCRQILTTG